MSPTTRLPEPWGEVVVPSEHATVAEVVAFLEAVPRVVSSRAHPSNTPTPAELTELDDIVTWMVWVRRAAVVTTTSKESYFAIFEHWLPTFHVLLARLHRLPGGAASECPAECIARAPRE